MTYNRMPKSKDALRCATLRAAKERAKRRHKAQRRAAALAAKNGRW